MMRRNYEYAIRGIANTRTWILSQRDQKWDWLAVKPTSRSVRWCEGRKVGRWE